MERTMPPPSLASASTERITIRAFRAVEDPTRCARYVEEHMRVLTDLGVISALQPDLSWCSDPNVVVLVAEHAALGMVAGIRLHVASSDSPLPMENSLFGLDATIHERLAALLPSGNAEIAGLWNAHRFAGRGVPMLLMEACVAVACRTNVKTLVTFIAEYVAPYAAKCGFSLMTELKGKGVFEYPIEGIRTHAMILRDLFTLTNAIPADRQRILSLRLRPHQERVEIPKQTLLVVQYELLGRLVFQQDLNLNAA